MERCDDFVVLLPAIPMDNTGVDLATFALPRPCRLVKSFWRQHDAFDGIANTVIRNVTKANNLTGSIAFGAGALDTVLSIDHREEDLNAWGAGELCCVRVTAASAGDLVTVTLVFRPL